LFESGQIWAFASCKLSVHVILDRQLQKLLQHLMQGRDAKFNRNLSCNFEDKNTHWSADTNMQLCTYELACIFSGFHRAFF